MISTESIMSISKNDLPQVSKTLNKEEISQLIEWLSLKDDNIRYQAFLLLQNRSLFFADVYPYWDNFRKKQKRKFLPEKHWTNDDFRERKMGCRKQDGRYD